MKAMSKLVSTACAKVGFLNAEEERDLIIKAKKGNRQALDVLFCANSRFILKQATTWAKRYRLDEEEAFSAACEGYVKAIQKFDLNRETRLVTLAYWWIQHCEQEELYRSHTIQLPHSKVQSAELQAQFRVASLDAHFEHEDDDNGTLGDMVGCTYADPADLFEKDFIREQLAYVMDTCLSAREAAVIRLYYGFTDGECHSLSEVGEALGMTKQRAGQIKQDAVRKLQKLQELSGCGSDTSGYGGGCRFSGWAGVRAA